MSPSKPSTSGPLFDPELPEETDPDQQESLIPGLCRKGNCNLLFDLIVLGGAIAILALLTL